MEVFDLMGFGGVGLFSLFWSVVFGVVGLYLDFVFYRYREGI